MPQLFSVTQIVTLSPPTSKVGGSNPRYYVGKLLTDGRQFTVQNFDQLYVLVSSAHKTTRCDITCTVLKATYTLNKLKKKKKS